MHLRVALIHARRPARAGSATFRRVHKVERTAARGVMRRLVPAVTSAIAMIMVIALPGVAHAASDHAVSGDTWSWSSEWYISTTYRTKSGDGNAKIKFSELPLLDGSSRPVDGIKWRYIANNGSVVGGSEFSMYSLNTWYTHWYLSNGFQFRNSFARTTTCTNPGCNHHFAGTQNY
ncbi:hypothetical protein QEZ54_01060 [Catellatospora sp. KI3]|uniref:hypothetical protein n=1 Tax=Catellatospora sp. KI3 TaxID=3041620 RepID=UPI002482CE47|nr:hypothetical protein [Catellatospora sp. KI3]MDI1459545.1 hypothetical protein [Catellatospora sp. KI3]